jgi:hypothetical protein
MSYCSTRRVEYHILDLEHAAYNTTRGMKRWKIVCKPVSMLTNYLVVLNICGIPCRTSIGIQPIQVMVSHSNNDTYRFSLIRS